MCFPYKPLRNFQRFEDMGGDLVAARFNLRDMQPHGQHGQRQRGVDYFGYDDRGACVGVQAKLRSTGSLTRHAVENDVRQAEGFHCLLQPLHRYVIVTSALPSDRLRNFVEELSCSYVSRRMFHIEIYFWTDVCEMLDGHPHIARRFYPLPKPPKAYGDWDFSLNRLRV
jgi:hypothetical protein